MQVAFIAVTRRAYIWQFLLEPSDEGPEHLRRTLSFRLLIWLLFVRLSSRGKGDIRPDAPRTNKNNKKIEEHVT